MRRSIVTGLIAAGLAVFAPPAHAFVAEVATSISASSLADDAQLEAAVQAAVRDVLERAIAFTPSVVHLHSVKRVATESTCCCLSPTPMGWRR